MRFASYRQETHSGLAAWGGNTWHGLPVSETGSLESLLAGGKGALQRAHDQLLSRGHVLDADAITFLPPISQPSKIICVGLNYADHTAESGFEPPKFPAIFLRVTTSLTGHDNPILRPHVSHQLDFEGELVAIIGKAGRYIKKDSALDHIAGYSIFNDASIRDYQFKSNQWTLGKNFDGTGAFGPEFVTADELPGAAKGLKIETRLNGQIVQSANTDQMIFDIPTLISEVSEAMTLLPGDLIVTGTPSGVGLARKPQLWMKPGDVCEISIEGLGILRNIISEE